MTMAAVVHADDSAASPSWTLRGFGSAGVAYSDHTDADYSPSVLKANGVGYSKRWSSTLDSRLGAQLSVKLDKRWSAVLQVISEQRLDNTYAPAVEWANIKYQASPELSLRLGRIALPIFLAADYRKVGYAYPWVRTPVEVYGATAVTNSDGIDATYRWNHNGVKNVTQGFFGRTDMRLPGTRIEARKVAGFSNTTEYGAVSARVSMLSTELTIDVLRPLFDALRRFGPPGAALADRYAVDHTRATAISIGASYDPGNWFMMAEVSRLRTRSFLGATTGMYVSAGYRFGAFTPYLGYARVRANSATTEAGLDLSRLPPAAAPAAARQNAYLNWLLTTIPVQRTVSIGARWDCATDVALKFQFDRVTPIGGSRGSFINVQPGFHSGHGVSVASAVLDFVF